MGKGKVRLNQYLPWAISGIIILVIYIVGTTIPGETIKQIIKNAGPWGPLLFIFLTLITYVFAPLNGTPFLFAGFYAFGQAVVFYTFIAVLISVVINFLIAKKWGRSLVERLSGEKNLQRIDKLTQNYGLVALFFFRLTLNSFHDIISYAAGLTSMKFGPYVLISILGMIPNAIFWYFVSSRVTDPFTYTALHMVIAYLLLIPYLVWVFLKKKYM